MRNELFKKASDISGNELKAETLKQKFLKDVHVLDQFLEPEDTIVSDALKDHYDVPGSKEIENVFEFLLDNSIRGYIEVDNDVMEQVHSKGEVLAEYHTISSDENEIDEYPLFLELRKYRGVRFLQIHLYPYDTIYVAPEHMELVERYWL